MKSIAMKLAVLLLSLLSLAPPVLAQEMTDAEVRKVDKSANKITLKHGEIKNLGMPPMTMVFRVQDPDLLDKFKAGDQVQFTADQIKGAYVVLTLQAKP